MPDNPIRRLLEAFRIACAQKSVEEDVIRLERSVGFEFAAPITFLVLRGEKNLAGAADGSGYTAEQAIDLAETKLWRGSQISVGGVCVHQCEAPLCARCTGRGGGDGLHKLRRQPEPDVFRHHFEFLHVVETFRSKEV